MLLKSPLYQRTLPEGCRRPFLPWTIDFWPGAASPDEAATGRVDFGAKTEREAKGDFPDQLTDFGTKAEAATLGASCFACPADCLVTVRFVVFLCASANGMAHTA